MRACSVMLSTKVDGVNNETIRDGEIEIFPRAAQIVYREENAQVKLCLKGEQVDVLRQGDYTLSLFLRSGETTTGEIGIGGNSGEILTKTHAIEYKISEDCVVARLAYDLIIGKESQQMELRLLAKVK